MSKEVFKRGSLEYEFEDGVWLGAKGTKSDFRFGKTLFNTMKANKNLVGQIDGVTGKEDTFGEMLDRSIRCSIWLKKQNIKAGDVIALCTFNHLNTMIPIVSSLFIGCIFNTWWQILERDLIKHYINLCKPKVLFTYEEHAKFVLSIVTEMKYNLKIIVFESDSNFETFDKILRDQDDKDVDDFQCVEIEDPNQPAMILFTSGTTGNPKGVLHHINALAKSTGFVPHDVIQDSIEMNFSTTAWTSGVLNPLKAIQYRAKMIVWSDISESDSFKLIEKYQVKLVICGTGVANRLSKDPIAKSLDLSSVKYLSFGGALTSKKVGETLQQMFPNAEVFQVYGSTESTSCMASGKGISRTDSCGVPFNEIQIKLINSDGKIVLKAGEEGEIYVKSPCMMLGYLKNEQDTKKVLDADGWYRTGDIAYFNENGEHFIIDRQKEFIKLRYTHIPSSPIENVISEHPGVCEVAVVAKPDIDDVEQPMAFVIKNNSVEVTESDIINLVSQKLPERFHLVGGVRFIDEFPRTSSGKVAKRKLREMAKLV